MSRMEVNKGKLIKQSKSIKEIAEQVVGKVYDWAESKEEQFKGNPSEYGYEVIRGILYKVEFEIEKGDEINEFCNIAKDSDGSINFHTHHYNGGAHWTELVEDKINKTT